jgi:hypothetical protein
MGALMRRAENVREILGSEHDEKVTRMRRLDEYITCRHRTVETIEQENDPNEHSRFRGRTA